MGSSKKKIVIIAVTSTVVAALVLIAILVGVYINAEAQKDIVQVGLERHKNTLYLSNVQSNEDWGR